MVRRPQYYAGERDQRFFGAGAFAEVVISKW